MRENGPLTNPGQMKDGDVLVSGTDLQGRIQFASAAFVGISGFIEIGGPGNWNHLRANPHSAALTCNRPRSTHIICD